MPRRHLRGHAHLHDRSAVDDHIDGGCAELRAAAVAPTGGTRPQNPYRRFRDGASRARLPVERKMCGNEMVRRERGEERELTA